jgi:hypothetical protein
MAQSQSRDSQAPFAEPAVKMGPCEAQRDALRIQAAAVAAQQEALFDEESRLLEHGTALTKQQEQLAAHLEEKRQRLVQFSVQVQAQRTELQRRREALDQQAARQAEELSAGRQALAADRAKLQVDRQRTVALRQRLKRRFHRRVLADRMQMRQWEVAVAARRRLMLEESEKVKKDREALVKARLIFNGDAELGKRRLQAEWEKLWQEIKQWKMDRDVKDTQLTQRMRSLSQRHDALANAEKALGDDRHQWELKRKVIEQEVLGLECRLQNLRAKLSQLHGALSQANTKLEEAKAGDLPTAILIEDDPRFLQPVPVSMPAGFKLAQRQDDLGQRIDRLNQIADDLVDQRMELVEHWQRAAQMQQQWLEQQCIATDDFLRVLADLPSREQALLARHQALEAAEDNLRKRQQELSSFRQHLEGWSARICLRESAWESERDRVLAEAEGQVALADKNLQAVALLRQRWAKRRRQEVALLRAERDVCERLRNEYATLRQECWKRHLALEVREHELAQKALALEEYRQAFLVSAHDAAAVDHKIERIGKRWAQANAATMRATTDQFRELEEQAAQLQQRGRELLKAAEEMTARETALATRQTAWEEQITQAEAQEAWLCQQVLTLTAQRARAELQAAQMQNEVERLARVLLDEVGPTPQQLSQAA